MLDVISFHPDTRYARAAFQTGDSGTTHLDFLGWAIVVVDVDLDQDDASTDSVTEPAEFETFQTLVPVVLDQDCHATPVPDVLEANEGWSYAGLLRN